MLTTICIYMSIHLVGGRWLYAPWFLNKYYEGLESTLRLRGSIGIIILLTDEQ